jgi:hypothetical protein
MFRTLFVGAILIATYAGSASADTSYSCMYRNVLNTRGTNGAERVDFVKLSSLNDNMPWAYWTPNANAGNETLPFEATNVQFTHCPQCFEVTAKASIDGLDNFIKVSIEQDAASGETKSNLWHRVGSEASSEWNLLSTEPGICLKTLRD